MGCMISMECKTFKGFKSIPLILNRFISSIGAPLSV